MEYWKGFDEPARLVDLTSYSKYPQNPKSSDVLSVISWQANAERNSFGARLRAFFVSPEVGQYTFNMSCWKHCRLSLRQQQMNASLFVLEISPNYSSKRYHLHLYEVLSNVHVTFCFVVCMYVCMYV